MVFLSALLVMPAASVSASRRGGRRRHYDHDDDDDDDDDDDYYDYKKAIKARKSGDIRPLKEILDTVSATFKGRYVGIEFKQRDGGAFYEIKLLTPEGQYLDITVDAKANRIVKVVGQ